MTSDRSLSYGSVIKTLADVGPAKLHEAEANILRDAADTLLFVADPRDPVVTETLTVVDRLLGDLVAKDRWTGVSARRLADDIAGCGPALVVA